MTSPMQCSCQKDWKVEFGSVEFCRLKYSSDVTTISNVWTLDPRSEKKKSSKRWFGDNWKNFNMDCILHNMMELLFIFLRTVVVLWLCRTLWFFVWGAGIRGNVSWYLQLSGSSGATSGGASSGMWQNDSESKTMVRRCLLYCSFIFSVSVDFLN